jgi:phosphate transport system substrate-binding protein
MTVQWGKCTNLKECKDAKQRQPIPIPVGAAFVCPECGGALQQEGADVPNEAPAAAFPAAPATAPAARVKKPSAALIVAIAALIVAVAVPLVLLVTGFAGVSTWGKLHGGAAPVPNSAQNIIIRLAGSNTIGDALVPALAEDFLKSQGATDVRILPGAKPQEKIVQGVLPGDGFPSMIEIAAHGSATAFTALADKSCDIGMASRRIKPDEAAKLASLGDMTSPGNEHILGLDGIAVIVNASNPLTELSKDQIKRIFTGEIADWSKVGTGHGAIEIYARDDKSGTFDSFKSIVLAGAPLVASARRFEDSNALSDAVSGDPNGIGFIGLPFIHNAKAIAVSEKGAGALKPTRLTVATEDYSLSRRLYLYTPAAARNKFMRMFVEFAISKQGQDVVAANGFVAQNVELESPSVADEAPDAYKQLTRNAERLSLDFRFQPGKAEQDNKALADLDRVVSMIADRGSASGGILLFGFADSTGAPEVNQALSLNRARLIASQLIQRGIKPAVVRGFGSELPVASNDTDDGREKNRRVEIWMKRITIAASAPAEAEQSNE